MAIICKKACSKCKQTFEVGTAAKNCPQCKAKGSLTLDGDADGGDDEDEESSEGHAEGGADIREESGAEVGLLSQFADESVTTPPSPARDGVIWLTGARVPITHEDRGNINLNLMVNFRAGAEHMKPRAMLRGILAALIQKGEKLKTGRKVENHGHAIVWILEQLAENCPIPLKL